MVSTSKISKILALIVFCMTSQSCRTVAPTSELDERVIMSDEITDEDRAIIENFFRDILNSYYAKNLTITDKRWAKELPFFRRYDEFAKKCRFDFHVYKKDTAIRNGLQYYTINVLVKTVDQPDADVSRLGSLSLTYFGIPENYQFKYDRGPESRHYFKIKDTHSKLSGLITKVSKRSPSCGEIPIRMNR